MYTHGGDCKGCLVAPCMIRTRSGLETQFSSARLLAFLGGPVASGLAVDPKRVLENVEAGVAPGMSTRALADLIVECASSLAMVHPDYSKYAGRMAVHDFTQTLPPGLRLFSGVTQCLLTAGLVSKTYVEAVEAHAAELDEAVAATAPLIVLDDFGFRTLQKSYLLRVDGSPVETPACMYMRVAVGIHGADLPEVLQTFAALALQRISHATPTLFFAGSCTPQMSSCFLLTMKEDSIEGIFDTLGTCARISKYAGGIGLAVHKIRGAGSAIRSTNGTSNGLVPMARVFSDTARYVDQGGGKRKGAFAMYLEPWHSDVFAWLDLKKNHGDEGSRARDLFYALWVPDLFMERVRASQPWSLFCPDEAPGLAEVHGAEFEELYTRYEREGRARRVVDSSTLWRAVCESIIETGSPFVLFKDACNAFSNHSHLGTLQCSNLCTEIMQYTSPDEIAVCNLGAVVLDAFVVGGLGGAGAGIGTPAPARFDFEGLAAHTAMLVRNLNRIIDINFYPVHEAAVSNCKNRPIGIGVVGLADTFAKMDMVYGDPESMTLNRDIFETMYFAAMSESVKLAQEKGCAYPSYAGSPLSQGRLQFDLMGVAVDDSRHDWTGLRTALAEHGARNSLLLAVMPTASTAQIIGRQESHEPFFSMMYSRRVLAGDFPVVNRYLVQELEALGLWTEEVRMAVVAGRGSVAGVEAIPARLRAKYATVFEIGHRMVLQMAMDRQPFICQGQSLNAHIAEPTFARITSMLFFAWGDGVKSVKGAKGPGASVNHVLKNGVYYVRRRPATNPLQLAHLARTGGGATGTITGATTGTGRDTEKAVEKDTEEDLACTSCCV